MKVGVYPPPDWVDNPFLGQYLGALGAAGARTTPVASADSLDSADVLQIHWPEAYSWLRPPRSLLARTEFHRLVRAAQVAAIPIVWVVHNNVPHQSRLLLLGRGERIYQDFSHQVSASIHLSESGRSESLRRYPALQNLPSTTIPHPLYAGKAAPTKMLPTDRTRLLVFGRIRSYKGIGDVLAAAGGLEGENTEIIIRGKARPFGALRLARKARGLKGVDLVEGYVPSEEVDSLFSTCHATLLPHRDVLNSGVALLSLSRGVPIIAPERGALLDLAAEVGHDWVRLYEPPLSATQVLSAAAWAAEPRNQPPDLSRFEPVAVARQTLGFLQQVCGDP